MKKLISIVITLSFIITIFNTHPYSIKAEDLVYDLYTKNLVETMKVGKKLKIEITPTLSKYSSKKPKWHLSNKKLKIVKKRYNYIVVKARKPGKCTVKCNFWEDEYGKHKIKLRITIKDYKVNYKNYKKIKRGMSYGQIKKLLGKPHDIIYSIDEDNHVDECIRWRNPRTRDEIWVDFFDGYVTGKRYS